MGVTTLLSDMTSVGEEVSVLATHDFFFFIFCCHCVNLQLTLQAATAGLPSVRKDGRPKIMVYNVPLLVWSPYEKAKGHSDGLKCATTGLASFREENWPILAV